MRAAIYAFKPTGRTKHIAVAMRDGFRKHGVQADVITRGLGVVADIAVAYGWNHAPVFTRYKQAGLPYLYFDLGYWCRVPRKQAREGYHRLAVSDWCSSKSMLSGRPQDRFCSLGISVKPWRDKSGSILITGMSGKAAQTHGFRPGQWERDTERLISRLTDMRITHRAKPSKRWRNPESIEDTFSRTHMLVTHHSNTAVDALVNGIPYYCVKGVARRLSTFELTSEIIESPPCVNDQDRIQLLYDIAYCQWMPGEMRSGETWEYVKTCILGSA